MADPTLLLQGAIVSALKAAPAVAGGRIYDRVPPDPVFPYVTVGEGDTVGDDNSCADASECNVQMHCWSRAVGMPEVKGIAALVRARCKAHFTLSGFQVTVVEYLTTRYLHDPDGLTEHAVVEFRYQIDHDT